jgi:hypothetical protein
MIPVFLLPEFVMREDGHGASIALDSSEHKTVLLTLGITQIVEQESLDVAICGSADGETWQQLCAFPQKFYCGTYSLVLDLARYPNIREIRAQWKMGRWGRGDQKPLFGFYLFAELAGRKMAGAA